MALENTEGGTFLIRLSKSEIGAVTIDWKDDGSKSDQGERGRDFPISLTENLDLPQTST